MEILKKNVLKLEESKKEIRSCFYYDEIKDISRCNITLDSEPNEKQKKICSQTIAGKHTGNLERHIRTKHQLHYKKLITEEKKNVELLAARGKQLEEKHLREEKRRKKKEIQSKLTQKVSITMSIIDLKSIIIELICKNGVPFSALNSNAFKRLLDPMYNALGCRPIHRDNVAHFIDEYAQDIIRKISKQCATEMINLKIDCVTRCDRSYLGVNIQFFSSENQKYIMYTLGVIELEKMHTAEYLKEKLIEVLQKFGIMVYQILSITTDNGSNVIKSAKLMNLIQQKQYHDLFPVDEDNNIVEDIDLQTNVEKSENILHAIEDIKIDTSEDFEIENIRCSVHTLQLGVKDAIDCVPEMNSFIKKMNDVSKTLRTERCRNLLREFQFNGSFKLSVITRWMSNYDMLKCLYDNKPLVIKISDFVKEAEVSASDWIVLEELKNVLLPCKIATIALQSETSSYTDFYRIWITCMMELKKFDEKNKLAKAIYENLSKRMNNLMGKLFHANLFLDPRYKRLYASNKNKKDDITDTLIQILLRSLNIPELKAKEANTDSSIIDTNIINANANAGASTSTSSTISQSNIVNIDTEMDEGLSHFAEYMNEFEELEEEEEEEENLQPRSMNEIEIEELKKEVQIFFKTKGLDPKAKNEDVEAFYKEKKDLFPRLYKLWKILKAVPTSEASVERLFSALHFILNELRSRLTTDNVTNILLLRCNLKDMTNPAKVNIT